MADEPQKPKPSQEQLILEIHASTIAFDIAISDLRRVDREADRAIEALDERLDKIETRLAAGDERFTEIHTKLDLAVSAATRAANHAVALNTSWAQLAVNAQGTHPGCPLSQLGTKAPVAPRHIPILDSSWKVFGLAFAGALAITSFVLLWLYWVRP